MAAGDENGRFLTHSSIRRTFLVRRTNNAAKKNGCLNASSGMGLMRKSQPASSNATNFESGSNSSSNEHIENIVDRINEAMNSVRNLFDEFTDRFGVMFIDVDENMIIEG